ATLAPGRRRTPPGRRAEARAGKARPDAPAHRAGPRGVPAPARRGRGGAVSREKPMPSLAEARPEDLFQLAVEAAPHAMVLVDSDGRLVLANAQIEQLFGYSRQELLGQPVEILVPGRFRAAHPDKRDRFFAAPQTRWLGAGRELYGLRKDGVEVPIEIGLNAV